MLLLVSNVDPLMNKPTEAVGPIMPIVWYFGFIYICRSVDKSLARPGRKKATATEDSDVHISYLLS